MCWVYNVERREEVLSSALATAPPGSFSASPATSLPLLKKKKKKRLASASRDQRGEKGPQGKVYKHLERQKNSYYAL